MTTNLLCKLFDRLAMTAVKALSPNVKATVLRQSLWSDAEEQVLATIPSVSHPTVRNCNDICCL